MKLKNNLIKYKIYKRTFAALFAAYLVLMTGFSVVLIVQQKKMETSKFLTLALQLNSSIDDILQQHMDSNNEIKEFSSVKKEFVNKLPHYTNFGLELAVFTRQYRLIFNTTDNWLVSYTDKKEGNMNHIGYGYLNPKEWFTEEETEELENYLYAKPVAKKAGDLTMYDLGLKGFWVDNEIIIPDKITVTEMYATQFDDNGEVVSSSGEPEKDIVYTSQYKNTKGLPYFQYGSIQPVYNNNEKQSVLRNLVADTDQLKESISRSVNRFETVSYEMVNPVTYRYYAAMPYQNLFKLDADQETYYSEFWTVCACEVNLLKQCIATLTFVWLSCFITFFIAAWIVSTQTYTLYQQKEKMDKQRVDTTNALAHDLKTPLSIISGYAQNLIENIHTEKRQYYASNINDNVMRMDRIIRQMLELSRLEVDNLIIKYDAVSLAQVCTQLINRYNQLCTDKHIMTKLEGDAVVKMDVTLMYRVLDNFFINAIEHTPDAGTICIKIVGNTLEFYNSGSHIPEEELTEIWQPFKKADGSRSNTKGTGLGLSIASKILELYHFSYGVNNVGSGVVFWFKW